jgi:hypothetical protein
MIEAQVLFGVTNNSELINPPYGKKECMYPVRHQPHYRVCLNVAAGLSKI